MQPIQPRDVPELEKRGPNARDEDQFSGQVLEQHDVQQLNRLTPEAAPENEIVGRPTMLAKYNGRMDAQQILDSLGRVGYPVEDVSVLFKVAGTDEVVDLVTGQIPAGQSLSEQELHRINQRHQEGQTAVLLHPEPEQLAAVKQALAEVGNADIEYAGETHAFGGPGGVRREDEQVS